MSLEFEAAFELILKCQKPKDVPRPTEIRERILQTREDLQDWTRAKFIAAKRGIRDDAARKRIYLLGDAVERRVVKADFPGHVAYEWRLKRG